MIASPQTYTILLLIDRTYHGMLIMSSCFGMHSFSSSDSIVADRGYIH